MRIKRFNESIEDNFVLIKDYFASFSEDLEDICAVFFNKVNDNLFEVVISFTGNTTSEINDESSLTKLDHWINMNQLDNKILKELSSSMQMLVNDDMLEEFKLTKHDWGYKVKIHTTIKGEVTDWVYVNPEMRNSITYDKNRLKKIIFDKFGIEVESSHMCEEFDNDNTRYLEFEITFKDKIKGEVAEQIRNYILNTEVDIDGDLEKIFKKYGLSGKNSEVRNLYFEIRHVVDSVN